MLRSLINKILLGLIVILLFSIIGCGRQGNLNSGDVSSTSNGVSESSSSVSSSESSSEEVSSEAESSSESTSSDTESEASSSVSSAGSSSSVASTSSVSSSNPSSSSSVSSVSSLPSSSSSAYSSSESSSSVSSVSSISSSSTSSFSESSSDSFYDGWTLVWSDEFDGPQIDTSVWSYERGYLRNNELQNYTDSPNNAYIENGMLIIKTIKEPSFAHNFENEDGTKGKWMDFSSASLYSRRKKYFTYGRFEIRARLPYGNAIWPAFWICGEEGQWPRNGEIDIMEFWGGPSSDHILRSNVHWYDNGHKQWGGKPYQLSGNQKFADDFHIIGLEWDEEALRFYVDGNIHHVFYLDTPLLQNIFSKPFFLRVNTAISPNKEKWGDAYLNTYPQTFEIDYVRVYQKI